MAVVWYSNMIHSSPVVKAQTYSMSSTGTLIKSKQMMHLELWITQLLLLFYDFITWIKEYWKIFWERFNETNYKMVMSKALKRSLIGVTTWFPSTHLLSSVSRLSFDSVWRCTTGVTRGLNGAGLQRVELPVAFEDIWGVWRKGWGLNEAREHDGVWK